MIPLGSEQRPIILKVQTEKTAEKATQICEKYGWHYIMGMEPGEDLTDLKKALKQEWEPVDPYSPCPCGSGKKYKFCCKEKMKHFDIHEYVTEFKG